MAKKPTYEELEQRVKELENEAFERKQAEEALRESEEKYRDLTMNINVGVYRNTAGPEGKFIEANPAIIRMFGYDSKEEFLKLNVSDLYQNPKDRTKLNAKISTKKFVMHEELKLKKKDGTPFIGCVSAVAVKDNKGELKYYNGIIEDVTEHKRAEVATEHAYAELRQLFNGAADAMCVIEQNYKVVRTNQTFSTLFGIKQDEAIGEKCFDIICSSLCNTPICPMVRIIDGVIRVEYEAEIQCDKETKIPCILTGTPFKDSDGKLIGIVECLKDITNRKRDEKELQDTLKQLRKAMRGTIQAMAMTVEKRDPYTAGHQRRVANLARAIGKEMGLSKEQIAGIRMAGIIHDLGKISVPAEILSKPGELTKNEFEIAKEHAQVGYDILNKIEFPWPVAQIVYQHHERMDGSGYPNGLSGEDIILEARILGLADVVEAMAAHRPYRPALGIDKALEEISKNKGVLYDPEVVDACLKVFTEKNFRFE